MGRQSPRFFGIRIGKSAKEVYELWENKGLIEKVPLTNGFMWRITELGRSLGGRLSDQGTPTFDLEKIGHLL